MSIRVRRLNNIKYISEPKYRFNIFHQINEYRHLNNYMRQYIDDINDKIDLSELGIIRKRLLRKRKKPDNIDLSEIGYIEYDDERLKMDLAFLDEIINDKSFLDMLNENI